MMLVGIWFRLYWVLFSFFHHYMQRSRLLSSSITFNSKFKAHVFKVQGSCIQSSRPMYSKFKAHVFKVQGPCIQSSRQCCVLSSFFDHYIQPSRRIWFGLYCAFLRSLYSTFKAHLVWTLLRISSIIIFNLQGAFGLDFIGYFFFIIL